MNIVQKMLLGVHQENTWEDLAPKKQKSVNARNR